MSNDDELQDRPDAWEAEFILLCNELNGNLLGKDGLVCILIIERWEKKHSEITYLEPFIRNHAQASKSMLAKNPGGTCVVINQGDNSNFQSGSNTAMAVGAGNTVGSVIAEETSTESKGQLISNIVGGVIAGGLAVWWCLPHAWVWVQARFLVTVFLVVATSVISVLGWLQFRRRNWEKFAYITLGGILIVRSALPEIIGRISAGGEANEISAIAFFETYLGFSEDNSSAVLELVAGVVLLAFAFFANRNSRR